MINLTSSTLIERPAQQVFDFISNPENNVQWHYGTLATSKLTGDISSEGTFFRSVGHWLGRRNLSTFEVTEYKPDRRYGFKSLSGPLFSQTSYTLEMADSSTKLDISIQVAIADSFQTGEDLLEKEMKVQLKENLAMLKDLLEAEPLAW